MPKAGAIDKIEWAFQKPIRFCLLLDVIIKPTACCKLLNVLFMADDSTLCCVDHRRSRLSCIVQGGSRQISAFYVVNSSRKSITHTAPAHWVHYPFVWICRPNDIAAAAATDGYDVTGLVPRSPWQQCYLAQCSTLSRSGRRRRWREEDGQIEPVRAYTTATHALRRIWDRQRHDQ